MVKRIAIVGTLLGLSGSVPAYAQFSGLDDSGDATATGGGGGIAVQGEAGAEPGGPPGRFAVGLSSHARGAARNVASLFPVPGDGAIQPSLSELSMGSASFKFFVTDRIALQALVGFGTTSATYDPDPLDDVDNEVALSGLAFSVGPRFLYTAARGEQSSLYLGVGLDVLYEDLNGDPDGPNNARGVTALAYVVSLPVGFEFALSGLPELRLSAEASVSLVNASFDYHEDNDQPGVDEGELGSATAIIIGSPGLDFITLGIHYYF